MAARIDDLTGMVEKLAVVKLDAGPPPVRARGPGFLGFRVQGLGFRV